MNNLDEENMEPEFAPDMQTLRQELTAKERKFCDFYLGEAQLNATRAAKMAGYAGTANVLSNQGYQVLKKAHVKAYIDAVLDEVAMSAAENLARLSSIARGSVDDLLSNDGVWLDLQKARANGSIHLLKKIKSKRTVRETESEIVDLPQEMPDDVKEIIEEFGGANLLTKRVVQEEIEFELYSATEALALLGKHHKLFTDRIDHSLPAGADVLIYIPDNGRD